MQDAPWRIAKRQKQNKVADTAETVISNPPPLAQSATSPPAKTAEADAPKASTASEADLSPPPPLSKFGCGPDDLSRPSARNDDQLANVPHPDMVTAKDFQQHEKTVEEAKSKFLMKDPDVNFYQCLSYYKPINKRARDIEFHRRVCPHRHRDYPLNTPALRQAKQHQYFLCKSCAKITDMDNWQFFLQHLEQEFPEVNFEEAEAEYFEVLTLDVPDFRRKSITTDEDDSSNKSDSQYVPSNDDESGAGSVSNSNKESESVEVKLT